MAETQKNYNKTIIQSSITNLEALYYLLKAVKDNQPMTYDYGKSSIFPAARARLSQDRGGEWDPNKNDTHTSITLAEMNLIRYENEDNTLFSVSDFGNRFLDTFDLTEIPADNGKFKLQLDDHYSKDVSNKFILDLLLGTNVVQPQYGRNNHPYLVLFKLLTEPELKGFITKSEWARFINASEFLTDDQYDQIRNEVLLVRKNNLHFDPVKSDRALTKLVQWGVLEKYPTARREEPLRFGFSADFVPTIRLYMLNGDIRSEADNSVAISPAEIDETTRLKGGTNVLLYGVPGSGKSWTIEHEYCTKDTIVERLVFHPDYTNADFVGQILPVVDPLDKMVTYEFTSGPFTNIMYEAYNNPTRKYVLIIEEINRGNAAAIFGDVFQLLDRSVYAKEIDGIKYPEGTSEYCITNENVAEKVYGDKNHKVRIPSNLSILGTMNTSDQNVFTLDTVFQRRWRMRLIENNFENVRISLASAKILDTNVTWKQFCETVNNIIIGNKAKMASAEDKRLGVYFIHEDDVVFDERALPTEGHITLLEEYNSLIKEEADDTITADHQSRLSNIREAVMHNRMFPEKVIKYLWDDAFKFNPEALFDTDTMDSLEKVIRTFVYSKGADRFKVFKQTVRDLLYPAQQQ